jgi:hypothetical protein
VKLFIIFEQSVRRARRLPRTSRWPQPSSLNAFNLSRIDRTRKMGQRDSAKYFAEAMEEKKFREEGSPPVWAGPFGALLRERLAK